MKSMMPYGITGLERVNTVEGNVQFTHLETGTLNGANQPFDLSHLGVSPFHSQDLLY